VRRGRWAWALLGGLLASAAGGSARAEPKASDPVITVAPFRGKGGAACAQALEAALGDEVTVEPWLGEGSAAGFRTWAELSAWVESEGQALGAQIVVVGTHRGNKLILEAYDTGTGALLGLTQVRTAAGKPCTPSKKGQGLLLQFVSRAQAAYTRRRAFAAVPKTSSVAVAQAPASPPPEAPPPPAAPAPVAAPPPPAAPEPPRAELELDDEPEPDDSYAPILQADPPRRPRRDPSAAPAAPAPPAAPVWASVDVEIGLSQRNLAFDDQSGAAAGTYQVGAMFTPGLRLLVSPFVDGPGWLRPLNLEVSYRAATAFESRPAANAEAVPTRYLEGAAAVAYRIEVPRSRFAVSPRIGAHVMQLALQTPGLGAGLDTPSVDYRSGWFGVAVDATLMATAEMRLRGGFMPLVHGGAIFGPQYFPEGGGWALDVQADLTVRVLPWLVGVISGHYTGYRLDLAGDTTPAAGTPVSATDRVTGLRVGLRLER
jgi:hypothetical protein